MMRSTADMLRALRKRRFGRLVSVVTGIMFLLIVLGTGQAESASFDCFKSTTQVEHPICDNPALSAR
jgi:uncharacterized protein